MPKETEGAGPIELLDQYQQPIPAWVKIPDKARTLTDAMKKKLREPFPPEALEVLTYGAKLTTIKAAYIIERLNEVFGMGRWVHHHKIIEVGTEVIALGRLEVFDYDVVIPEQYGGMKGKGADSYKGAVTNSLSKCASYLEVGIDVFKGSVSAESVTKAKAAKATATTQQSEADQIVAKIKNYLLEKNPKLTGPAALNLFKELSGLNWTSWQGITLAQAKAGYANLIANANSNGTNK